MKATLIKSGLLRGDANLYKLSQPLEGNEYVIVSAIGSAFDTGRSETYIFPANAEGEVVDWLELSGSEQGIFDHERALRNAGYEVE